MTTFIIITLIIFSLVMLGFYIHKAEESHELQRVVLEQRKYIQAINSWYKPDALKEVRIEEVKKNYEKDLKSVEDKFKRDMESFERTYK